MKKLLALLMCIPLALCFVACGEDGSVSKVDPPVNPSSAEIESKEDNKSDKDVVAGVGETLDYNGLQMTLDSVKKYEDNSEYFTDDPGEGKMFVLLWITVSNTTDEDDYVNMFYEDSYCDDIGIDPAAMLVNVDGKELWGDVAAGKKAKGYVAYALDENWQTLEFYYKPEIFGDESSKMMFKVTRADMTE